MNALNLALTFGLLALTTACEQPDPPTEQREAPDVPWPSVEIAGEVESPGDVGDLLVDCFAGEAIYPFDYGEPTLVHYADKTPDGDDQQPAELCVTWSTHLDVGDCVRRALLKLGAEVIE